MKKVDLAYLAGFFDGEGSISIQLQQGKYLRIEVACAQNTADVLWMYVRTFKGNVYRGTRCLQWKTYGAQAVTFLRAMQPFLIVKRLDAEEVIEAWETYKDDVERITALIQTRRLRHERLKEHYDRDATERKGSPVR